MKIGIVSHFMPHDLNDLLDTKSRDLLPEIGGVLSTPVTPIVREWHKRGHDLIVFTLDPSVRRSYQLKGPNLSIHVLPKRRSRYCLLDCYLQERRLIRAAVASESPDVLSAQWSYEHALAALSCGLPTVVTCHDAPFRCAWIAKHWHMSYHLFLAWKVIRKADRLICVSPYTAKHIQQYFRPHCPVDIIPNGLDSEVFERGRRRLEKDNSVSRPYTICSVGGWGALKNQKTLLRAFAALPPVKDRPARLVLFGPGTGSGEAAESWARMRDLYHNVEFHGSKPREQILDFFETEADLMVHPSLIETHGMVLIEAMACGVPVIGGIKSGAVPWTLEEGDSGFLCDVRDVNDVARAILFARDQAPEARYEMALRAWHSVSQRFRVEDAAFANEEVLKKLARL
jgi:glycosyltransferase involved in cell wall biosynthesis